MKRVLTTVLSLALLAGCGGNLDQQEAREEAVEASCDRAERCGQIGDGEEFLDRDECEVEVAAFWNGLWPKDQCDGNIRSDDLERCVRAIEDTSCSNGLDFLNTLGNRCSRELVCAGEE
jgi:hypothetical protein